MTTKLFDKENWNNSLASYLIDYWLNSQISQLPKWSDFLDLLGLEESNNFQNQLLKFLELEELFSGLVTELEAKVKEIINPGSIDSIEKITEVEEELFSWYYGNPDDNNADGCTSRLEFNFRELRQELRDKNKKFLSLFWTGTSPKPSLKYLAKAEGFMLNLIQQYKIERQSCKVKEQAGRQSCELLYSKSYKSQLLANKKENYHSIINLLSHIYRCKIRIEILTLAIEILESIIRDDRLYIDNLIKSVSFLRKIKESIEIDEEKPNNYIIELAKESLMIQPEELCKELEISFDCSINRWESCNYISEIEVKKKILEKVSGISSNLYQAMKQEFTPTVSSSSLQLVKSN